MDIKTILSIGFFLLVLWYAIFLTGTFQFRALQKRTIKLVLEKAKEFNESGTALSCEEIFKAVYPEWRVMVPRTAWFILSKSELRPISASPANVEQRLKFSPEWIKTILQKQGLMIL